MIPWSKIQDTKLARIASWMIDDDNAHLDYHNWYHVLSMYQYLADTNEPYDEALDWAVLFHDIVYDEHHEKEYRSMKKFIDMSNNYEGCALDTWEKDRVCQLILYTQNHIVTQYPGSSAIIRADLHGLTNRLTAYQNFNKIMKESMLLYGIDEAEFIKNSEEFMNGLLYRVCANIIVDPDHKDFYASAAEGISMTIKLSQIIQGKM